MPLIIRRLQTTLILALLCCPGLQSHLLSQTHHDTGDVAVVANADVPVSNLSFFEIRHIFKGDRQYWKSDLPVVLLAPPSGSHGRDVMLQVIYRMTESEYKQYWVGRIFRGAAISPPKTAESSTIANDLVASLNGCISLMNASDVGTDKNIKVLKVNGKSPGEKDYPLK